MGLHSFSMSLNAAGTDKKCHQANSADQPSRVGGMALPPSPRIGQSGRARDLSGSAWLMRSAVLGEVVRVVPDGFNLQLAEHDDIISYSQLEMDLLVSGTDSLSELQRWRILRAVHKLKKEFHGIVI